MKRMAIASWILVLVLVPSLAMLPSTAEAQAMVEVPNAPPPPPRVVEQHRGPSRYEVGGTSFKGSGTGFPDETYSRVRGEAGLRLLVPLGHHLVVYPRLAVGGDYFSGQTSYGGTTPGGAGPELAVATASSFLCEAGGGLVATLGRHFALGAYAGVPVAPVMRVSFDSMAGIKHLGSERFTAVDLTASAVLALRL